MKDEHTPNSGEIEEAVTFDDCLRILVNTPPQPKKGKDRAPPDEGEDKKPEK